MLLLRSSELVVLYTRFTCSASKLFTLVAMLVLISLMSGCESEQRDRANYAFFTIKFNHFAIL